MHLTGILIFSTREIIADLSLTHADAESIDLLEAKSSFANLTSSLDSSERYSYLKKHQTLKLFLTVLHRLLPSSSSPPSPSPSIKSSSPIPDAPPFPADMLVPEPTGEETLYISHLFDENNSNLLSNGAANQKTTGHRSSTSNQRTRTLLSRYLERDSLSEDGVEQDEYQDLFNYLDRIYFMEKVPIVIDDLKLTLNSNEQVEHLAHWIKQPMVLPRFIHSLLQNDILTKANEDLLFTHLGISLEQTWSLKMPINTLIVLLKIVLKRKNNELISAVWTKFLQAMASTSEELTLESLEIFLVFFHQLTMSQRKSLLLELVNMIQTTKQNVYFLMLFEYMMYHFYEIPSEIIERVQTMLSKTSSTMTTNFNQILSHSSSHYLDSFALKTLYHSPIYNPFYDDLIKQLDFTKINKDDLSPAAIKQYYDLLWRILGYLPPSIEFLDKLNTYTDTPSVLHLFRLEKKVLHDRHIKDFLGKEVSLKDVQWIKAFEKKTFSPFDLLVYQILLQNLPPETTDVNRLYSIFLEQFKASLNINPYLESISSIPMTKPSEEKTKPVAIPTLPTEFEDLVKFQLNTYFEQENLHCLFLREILQILASIHPEIDDKQIYIRIQLDSNLQFIRDQIKLKGLNADTLANDMNEYIYKQIFQILFEKTFPNEIITDEIYHDLIKYLDEQFHVQIFQRCLQPHDLFDLLYLTSRENLSVSVFARMLMLFNKIFSHSHQFPALIQSLNRLADVKAEDLARWLTKLVLPQNNESNLLYSSEQCKTILETFTKYLIKKNDDGTNMIGEQVSFSILSVLINLGHGLLKPDKMALGFPQIIQLLVILAGHGSGNGHTVLFPAAATWLETCADTLGESNE